MEPEEMAVAGQWLSKHVSRASISCGHSNRYTKIEELLEVVFSVLSVLRLCDEKNWSFQLDGKLAYDSEW
jgi:hypothetical protein